MQQLSYTILRPNNFYQNDYWYQVALLQHGIYPQPIGDIGLARVDVRDIAEAAAIALTTGGHSGQTYNLVGPEPQTGQSTAAVWSRALDKPIVYAGNDLEVWERQALQSLPGWLVFELKLTYAFFQANGTKASAIDIERQTNLLGHAPRRFEDFADEVAQMWQADRLR